MPTSGVCSGGARFHGSLKVPAAPRVVPGMLTGPQQRAQVTMLQKPLLTIIFLPIFELLALKFVCVQGFTGPTAGVTHPSPTASLPVQASSGATGGEHSYKFVSTVCTVGSVLHWSVAEEMSLVR